VRNELYNIYFSTNIQIIKCRRKVWAVHVERTREERKAHTILQSNKVTDCYDWMGG
jgi:hypothetical protein